jgi:hypothetical protein
VVYFNVDRDTCDESLKEGMASYVPMYTTLMGSTRAGSCAVWATLCFPGAGLRHGHVFRQIAI